MDNLKPPKKQKVDKRELPENNKFSCEVCDRGYKTEEKYLEHKAGHEKVRIRFLLSENDGFINHIVSLGQSLTVKCGRTFPYT